MAELSKYSEYPHSDFPVSVDTWENMQDLNVNTAPVAKQYSTLVASNDFVAAGQYLAMHPEIEPALMNAEKINKLMDGIKATQKFFKDEVKTYLDRAAQGKIGIDDNATGTGKKLISYSADKIDSLHKTSMYALEQSKWTKTDNVYVQNITISGITSEDSPIISCGNTVFETKKKAQKYLSMSYAETYNGGIKFTCAKQPDLDFIILVKGK